MYMHVSRIRYYTVNYLLQVILLCKYGNVHDAVYPGSIYTYRVHIVRILYMHTQALYTIVHIVTYRCVYYTSYSPVYVYVDYLQNMYYVALV